MSPLLREDNNEVRKFYIFSFREMFFLFSSCTFLNHYVKFLCVYQLDLRCGGKKSLADPPKQFFALKSCDISLTRPHLLLVGGRYAFL